MKYNYYISEMLCSQFSRYLPQQLSMIGGGGSYQSTFEEFVAIRFFAELVNYEGVKQLMLSKKLTHEGVKEILKLRMATYSDNFSNQDQFPDFPFAFSNHLEVVFMFKLQFEDREQLQFALNPTVNNITTDDTWLPLTNIDLCDFNQ